MITDNIKKWYEGKRVVVTGGSGMIGRPLVRDLLSFGAKVTVASMDSNVGDLGGAEFVQLDLRDYWGCRGLIAGSDLVFHVAGTKGSVEMTRTRPADFLVPLLQMNTNVLAACMEARVDRVLYTSSIGAYPAAEKLVEPAAPWWDNPSVPMDSFPGWAKRIAELQIKAYRLQHGFAASDKPLFVTVRPSNVYGLHDNMDPDTAMVVPSLLAKTYKAIFVDKTNTVQVWGDGSAVRDFVFADDVAEGCILAMYYCDSAVIQTMGHINLGGSSGISIRQLTYAIDEALGYNTHFEFDPSKPSGYPVRVMSSTFANKHLGWKQGTPLVDGLKKVWEWYCDGHKSERWSYFK